ncbi:DUF6691 family protein [Vibrio sp. MA40-2]|uniref:DUF6691 family protein n=1 Tax=Vibrio sp. MA40-2 TaxID=3391828 RepID=UPI0039A6D1D4
MFAFVSLFCGILFGLGMAVSGMVDPDNVVGFLDVAGNWSPDVMFVMGGALSVFIPVYLFVIKTRSKPIFATEFGLPIRDKIDARLITGAAIFGLGWGLVGLCPGPVVSSLLAGNIGVVIFFASMMVGLGAVSLLTHINNNSNSAEQVVTSN